MRLSSMCMVLFAVWLITGCGQRIRADVTAVAEDHYSPSGQTYALLLMDDMPDDDVRYLEELRQQLAPALEAAGYAGSSARDAADVLIFTGWGASGPYYVYHRAYPVRRPFGTFRHRGFHGRRSVVVAEALYERTLRIDAVRNAGDAAVDASPTAAEPEFLWRVTVSSMGTLSRAQRLLPALAAAAAPWLGKSAQVRVQVHGDAQVTVLSDNP